MIFLIIVVVVFLANFIYLILKHKYLKMTDHKHTESFKEYYSDYKKKNKSTLKYNPVNDTWYY